MQGLGEGVLGTAILDLTVELILAAPCKNTHVKPLRLPEMPTAMEVAWLGPTRRVTRRAGVAGGGEVPWGGMEGWRMQPSLGAAEGGSWDGNSTGAVSGAGTGTASPAGLSGNITGQG